jgi:hypothetical protein
MMIEHRTTEVQLRIEKCAEILLNGHVDEIFPLFTPLEEKKWVQGWNPEFIFPKNGVAEEQMIFVTPPRFAGEDVYRWVMSKFRQEDHHVEYVVVFPTGALHAQPSGIGSPRSRTGVTS